ncbi:AbiA family abortive infection protein [Miniphocaeibacter halophilus]|uniref:AbiA family abortive infection protein n=1 Tax=Miniphocaeibacter halophilus TaxID=2931922 RepID=A0AC61MQU4_9FIRM|nr:AbiA family abortive infection protein [Miniphocaeibacter halophilus]QQK06960.1 AbiA family abortive infection protein [Miniphocaeibacter halophilus]
MLFIDYNLWLRTCKSIFKESPNRLKMYLQLYPIGQLSKKDKEKIMSMKFFENNIENGLWMLEKSNLEIRKHYYINNDGSFRNVNLVSPIMFLVIQCFGFLLNDNFSYDSTDKKIFYAGNLMADISFYAEPYNDFAKSVKIASEEYEYFIKLDIKSFYDNISLDILFSDILSIKALPEYLKDEKNLLLFKTTLSMIGGGKYPTIENSSSLSYIASVIYLEDVENKFIESLKRNKNITSFKIFRYVDDTYILLNLSESVELADIFLSISSIYNSIISKKHLTLNNGKSTYDRTIKINEVLRQAFYDEEVNEIKFNIQDKYRVSLIPFLEKLNSLDEAIDFKEYEAIIDEIYTVEDIALQPQEIFTTLSLKNIKKDKNKVIKLLDKLILSKNNYLRLDPKRLTRIIVNTNNGKLIKSMLNRLFRLSRNDNWTIYEMCSLIQYFLMRGFQHLDLLELLKEEDKNLYYYYIEYCKDSFWINSSSCLIELSEIKKDDTICFLYGMYLCNYQMENYINAYSYFKSFFDRYTAWLAMYSEVDKKSFKKKKPNIKKYYSNKSLSRVYKKIDNAEKIIKKAHDLRNASPINHSSAELINKGKSNNELKAEIDESILEMKFLITSKINNIKKNKCEFKIQNKIEQA